MGAERVNGGWRAREEGTDLDSSLVTQLLDRLEGVAEICFGIHLVSPELVHRQETLEVLSLFGDEEARSTSAMSAAKASAENDS